MSETEQKITIPTGTMVNLSRHEDDDAETLVKDVHAIIQGPVVGHALPVIIPAIDPDRVFYIHQSEKSPAE